MKHLKKFENFDISEGAEPITKPDVKPATTPTKRPSRPSPIRRDRPDVEPHPKARRKQLRKASAQDVVKRYKEESK